MNIDIKHLMTTGEILKEEKVKSIARNIIPGTLVLENYEPFPGYYGGNIPADTTPMSVFIVLAKRYDLIVLTRLIQEIRIKFNNLFNGTTANIHSGRTNYFTIRINNLKDFSDIYNIQENLINRGIELHAGRNIDKTVLITIQRAFLLEQMENHIYKNLLEESNYYFPLETFLTWEQFRALTTIVKNNIPNTLFDAALGYFCTPDGIKDVVRIYDRKNTWERINEIREHYRKAIMRI